MTSEELCPHGCGMSKKEYLDGRDLDYPEDAWKHHLKFCSFKYDKILKEKKIIQ